MKPSEIYLSRIQSKPGATAEKSGGFNASQVYLERKRAIALAQEQSAKKIAQRQAEQQAANQPTLKPGPYSQEYLIKQSLKTQGANSPIVKQIKDYTGMSDAEAGIYAMTMGDKSSMGKAAGKVLEDVARKAHPESQFAKYKQYEDYQATVNKTLSGIKLTDYNAVISKLENEIKVLETKKDDYDKYKNSHMYSDSAYSKNPAASTNIDDVVKKIGYLKTALRQYKDKKDLKPYEDEALKVNDWRTTTYIPAAETTNDNLNNVKLFLDWAHGYKKGEYKDPNGAKTTYNLDNSYHEDFGGWENATDEQIKTLTYWYNTDRSKANKYFESVSKKWLEERSYKLAEQASKDYENASGAKKFWYGVKDFFGIEKLPSSVLAFTSEIVQLVADGEVSPYTPAFDALTKGNTINAEIMSDMNPFLKFVYSAGSSTVQNVIGAATLGEVGYLASMGLQAQTTSYKQYIDSGADPDAALITSGIIGTVEILSEKVGLETWLKGFDTKTAETFIKSWIKSMGYEASEEVFSSIAGKFAESVVMGSDAPDEVEIRRLMTEEGLTYERAKEKVTLDNIKDTVYEAVVAAVSAGLSGGTVTLNSTVSNKLSERRFNNAIGQRIFENNNVDSLVDEAQNTLKNAEQNPDGIELSETTKKGIKNLKESIELLKDSNNKKYTRNIGQLFANHLDLVSSLSHDSKVSTIKPAVMNAMQNIGIDAALTDEALDIIWRKVSFGTSEVYTEEQDILDKIGGEQLLNELISDNELAAKVTAQNFLDGAISGQFNNFIQGRVDSTEQNTEQSSEANLPNTSENVKENTASPLTLTEPDGREIVDMPTYKEATEDAVRKINGLTIKTGTQKHIEKLSGALKSVSKVVWDESVPVGEGSYDFSDKSVHLNPNSSVAQNYEFLFKHEAVHSLESKAKYNQFETWLFEKSLSFNAFINMIAERNGIEFTEDMTPEQKKKAVIDHYAKRYADKYGHLKENIQTENAKREMVADYVGGFLFTGESYEVNAKNLAIGDFSQDTEASLNAIEEIANEDKSFIRMIIDFIKDLRNKINLALGKSGKTVTEDLKRAEQYLETVYKSAEVKSDVNTGVKYSINQNFSDDFDNWDKKNNKKVFTIGTTSDVLQKLGVENRSITWDASKILRIMSKHSEMTGDIIKQVPNILEYPIIVMNSKTNSSRITMFGEVYAQGKPVLAVLELTPNNKKGLRIDEIKIASAYAKEKAQNLIDSSTVLYVEQNKKRVSTFETLTGLQLPVGGANSINIISSNTANSQEKVSENVKKIFGFDIKEGVKVNEDLLEELSIHHPEAEVDTDGNVTVYHRTSAERAKKIKETGIMIAKEDALFFSSKETGYNDGYGDTVVKLKIPSTELEVNDIFEGEVHFDIPLKYKNGGFSLDVSNYLVNDKRQEKFSKGIPVPTLRYNTEEFAKSLIRKARSTIETEDVTEQLKEIVKAYNKFDTDTADKLISKLTLEIAEYQKPVREYYAQEYLDNLKGETVRVFKEDMGDIDFAGDTLKGLKESTGIKFVISESEAREWLSESKGEKITSKNAFKNLCREYGLVIDNDGKYSGLDNLSEIGADINEDSTDMSPIEQLKNRYDQMTNAYEPVDEAGLAEYLAKDIYDQLENTGARAENKRITQARREGVAKGEGFLNEYKEKQKRQRDAATKAARMRDLQKKTDRLLKSFERRLVKPTRASHIPTELVRACVDALEIVQQNPVLQDEMAIGSKYAPELEMLNQRIQNATTEEERDKWKAKYERKLHIATAIADKVQKIQDIFEKFKNNKKYSEIYTQGIIDALINLKQTIQDTEPYNYDEHQLLTVLNTFAMLDTMIKNQDRMIASKIKQGVSFVAQTFMDEVKRAGGKLWASVDTYVTALTDPKRYFDRLGNYEKDSAASQIYNMLNEGSQNAMRYKMEAQYIFRHLLSGSHNIKEARALQSTKRADLVDSGLVTEDGKRIMVTKAMRISLFMHSLNEQNMKHLMSKVYVRDADVYGYIKDVISWQENIAKVLTDYEVEWVKALQEYYGKYSADHLNEVTRELYGFEKAIVPNYFPIKTVSDYTKKPMEDISYDFSLEAAGFLKNRVDASNPLELVDAIAQINSDIDRHAKFYGLAIPMRNFNMVYNYTAEGWSESVKDAINQKFESNKPQEYVIEGPEGPEIVIEQKKNKEKPINAFTAKGTQYIEKMISDLIKRSDREVSIFDTLRGRYAQAVLAFNIPVSLKQAASYPTAIATLGWKPILKALAVIEREGGRKAFGFARAEQELIKKYSPLLWYRIQGGTDTELHDIFAKKNAGDQLSSKAPWLFNWIQKVDTATVGRLWYAAKYYVDDNFRGLTKDSDAYYKKVAEVFNKTIEETQPNYNTLQRPQILRSQNPITQTVTMFYTQRLQNMNILIGSALELKATLKNVKTGHATESDVKQAKRKLGRAIISQVVAANVLSLMQLAASALINNMKPYRDDDDELTVWSVLSGYFNTVFETLIGSALFGTEVYAIGKTLLSAGKWYGLSVPAVESINDLVNNGIGVVNGIKKSVKLAKDGASVSDIILAEGKTLNNLASAIARFAGVPLENMEKVGLGIYNDAKDLFQGEAFANAIKDNSVNQFFGKAIQSKSQKYNVIYKALQDGDTAKAETKYQELISSGTKESSINQGILKAFKEDSTVIKQINAATEKLKNNSSYKRLDGDSKAAVQQGIKNYFAKKAMSEVFEHTSDNYQKEVKKADRVINKGVSVDIYLVAKEMFKKKYADTDKSGGVSKAEKYDAIDNLDTSESVKSVLYDELIK